MFGKQLVILIAGKDVGNPADWTVEEDNDGQLVIYTGQYSEVNENDER